MRTIKTIDFATMPVVRELALTALRLNTSLEEAVLDFRTELAISGCRVSIAEAHRALATLKG